MKSIPIYKSDMKDVTVGECLTLIHINAIASSAINEMSKEKLSDFVMEIFNKGLLNNYLNLNS